MDKIRDLEIYILGGRDSPDQWASASLIIRVLSDDGEVGYGEAIPTRRVNQVVKALEEIRELIKGREVYALPKLYWEWYKHEYYLPFSIESVSAYSALDIAIYDLLGRRREDTLSKGCCKAPKRRLGGCAAASYNIDASIMVR